MSYLTQFLLTAAAKFESASKVSLYRKSSDVIFSVLFQILFFQVSE